MLGQYDLRASFFYFLRKHAPRLPPTLPSAYGTRISSAPSNFLVCVFASPPQFSKCNPAVAYIMESGQLIYDTLTKYAYVV